MAETKHILILANSKHPGGFCVAGKLTAPLERGLYNVGQEWIRLVDPRQPGGGVPWEITRCQGGAAVRPPDIIKVDLLDSCKNANHPEDWFYDPSQRWQIVSKFEKTCLAGIVDKSTSLWHDGLSPNAVSSGFVARMSPQPASICLIPAPPKMDFLYYKKSYRDNNTGQNKTKYVRELSFNLSGFHHDFSVTDPEFMDRHNIRKQMTEVPQLRRIPDASNYFLCLSLGLAFNERHYKIAATIFEP